MAVNKSPEFIKNFAAELSNQIISLKDSIDKYVSNFYRTPIELTDEGSPSRAEAEKSIAQDQKEVQQTVETLRGIFQRAPVNENILFLAVLALTQEYLNDAMFAVNNNADRMASIVEGRESGSGCPHCPHYHNNGQECCICDAPPVVQKGNFGGYGVN